jgi:hypothetical protein
MARRSLHRHEMSDWDRMGADYDDPNINSYFHGPVELNLLPSHSRYVCMELVLHEDSFDYLLTSLLTHSLPPSLPPWSSPS